MPRYTPNPHVSNSISEQAAAMGSRKKVENTEGRVVEDFSIREGNGYFKWVMICVYLGLLNLHYTFLFSLGI